jgi:hypothetical protein
MRLFYQRYPKGQTLSGQFELPGKSRTVSGQSEISQKVSIRFPLSWSHYCLLISIDDDTKRSFYEIEAIKNNWSVRELDRQINSMLYERLALSRQRESSGIGKGRPDRRSP